jgi:hypothetical protein
MVKPFRFETCKEMDGKWIPTGNLTPTVLAETPTEAMEHPDIKTFFQTTENIGHRIYRQVN